MKQTTQSEYKKSLIYCRVSSDRQANEGSGLDSQEHRCIKFAEDQNLSVAKIFRDSGISGGLFDRPAMQELINYLDDHPKERFVVIFDDLKRFARDVGVHRRLKAELYLRHVKLQCLNFNFEDTPEGEFIETIIAAQGELERKQNARQVIQKQKARLEAGYWSFHAPPGFKMQKIPLQGKTLVADEPAAGIIREAFIKFKDFELNTIEAVNDFIKTQYHLKGLTQKIKPDGAKKMLSNPLYAGYLAYEPWDISFREGKHKGIISIEIYLAVQEKLLHRVRPKQRIDYSEDFVLRNYVLCSTCKKPMTASYHTGKMGKRYPHYWCKNSGCLNKNRTILKKDIDTDFIKLLNELQPKKEVINLAEAVLNDMWADRQKYEEQRRAGITKDMQGIDIKIKNYLDRITSNSSSVIAKHYELEIEKLDKEKTALEAELNKQRYLDYDFKPACRTVFNFLENPLKNWKDPLYSRKRIFLHMYFERGLAYDKQNGFGTPELPCVIKVITQKHVSKKSLVEMPGVKPGSKTNSSTHYSQD